MAIANDRNNALYFTQALRILLADDHALNREIAVEAIRRHFENADIVEAATGKEVVDILQANLTDFQNRPGLVLMDMQMPEMTGIEATHYIREHISADLPIIALTASTTPEEMESALAAGMNRHLSKPFKPQELARAIAETLHLQIVPVALAPAPPPPSATAATEGAAAFDLTFLRDFTNGEEAQVQYFLQKFMENYPLEIKHLEAALITVDREALFQVAHSFRPQLEFVGLHQAAKLTLQLEQGARAGQAATELAALLEQVKAVLQSLPVLYAMAATPIAKTAGTEA